MASLGTRLTDGALILSHGTVRAERAGKDLSLGNGKQRKAGRETRTMRKIEKMQREMNDLKL